MKYSKQIQLLKFKEIQEKVLSLIPDDVLNGNTARYIIPEGRLESIEYFLNILELKEELIRLNLIDHIFGIALNITDTKYDHDETIHIDSKEQLYSYSLNIPIIGYQTCSINFYDIDSPNDDIIQDLFRDCSPKHFAKKFTLIESIGADTPIIINTKVAHSFNTTKDQLRIVMLIRLANTANEIIESIIQKV